LIGLLGEYTVKSGARPHPSSSKPARRQALGYPGKQSRLGKAVGVRRAAAVGAPSQADRPAPTRRRLSRPGPHRVDHAFLPPTMPKKHVAKCIEVQSLALVGRRFLTFPAFECVLV